MTGAWAAAPPEINSGGFWLGPGASTFFSSAATLESLVALLVSVLGGHMAAEGAQAAAWDGPAGVLSISANAPYHAWMAEATAQLQVAAAQIMACGEGFETLKAATPTPVEVTSNQSEHVALNMANFLGMLTPLITANRADYGRMWTTAATNKYSYAALSASTVQAIPPLPPPTPTAAPMGGGGVPTSELASAKPLQQAAGSESGMGGFMPILSSLMQAGQGLSGGGGSGLFSSAAQPLQGMMQPLQQMLTQALGGGGGLNGLGAADGLGSWITATPTAGGPVTASLGGGGGFGGGGFGGTSAVSALRGPVSWSSTVNAAGPAAAPESSVSRIAEARAASTAPATSGAMGSPGAMMGPMAHGAGRGAEASSSSEERDREKNPLLAAAALYRAPTSLPVVTGGSGTQFMTGEEDGQSH
jgi:PPE-repeat protein